MLGPFIRQARQQRGMTQTELAERSGLAQSYISMLERGQYTKPGLEVLQGLARAFDMPIGQLVVEAGLTPPVLDALRAEGIPADVLARLQEIYPDLTAEDLELAIEITRLAKPKRPHQAPERAPGAAGLAGRPGEGEQPPEGSGRLSAAGRPVRRFSV